MTISQESVSSLAHVPAMIYEAPVDPWSPPTFVSDHVVELTGYPPQRFLDDVKMWPSLIHHDDKKDVLTYWFDVIPSGHPFSAEYRIHRRDGRIVWVRDEAEVTQEQTVTGVTLRLDRPPGLITYGTYDESVLDELRQRLLYGEDPLDRLAAIKEINTTIQGFLLDVVTQARNAPNPKTWQEIGDALGVSKQAVLQRFRKALQEQQR